MSTVVRIPISLRTLTAGADEVAVTGSTLREVIDELEQKHPGLKDRLVDGKGVRRYVNIYLGEEDARFSGGLEAPVAPGAQISIIPALAGG